MFFRWSWGSAGGLVVAGGVEGELAEEFAGDGVDDPDVEVIDEFEDGGTGVFDAETGQLLRELTLDPRRDYQPLGRPPGPPKKTQPTS